LTGRAEVSKSGQELIDISQERLESEQERLESNQKVALQTAGTA
jgi:hypothetical protein